MSTQNNIANIWNREYEKGKYDGEAPIAFVDEIQQILKDYSKTSGKGLYVGCGNGRNYIPLLKNKLDLTGLDVSNKGLTQILDAFPPAEKKLVEADYLGFEPGHLFDYVISLQTFQHGNIDVAREYFEKTAALLKPGGLFFLRVNSSNSDVFFDYDSKQQSQGGGIELTSSGDIDNKIDVHFFSKGELESLTNNAFSIVRDLHEIEEIRHVPKTGRWVEWEGVWQKT